MLTTLGEWLVALIPHFKAIHIASLAVWVGGLFALPFMLARHDPAIGQADYSRIRRATHYGYTLAITPAAAVAVVSGIALIFLRELYTLWMFGKLIFVAGLVAFHTWVGYILVHVAEVKGRHEPPSPVLPSFILMVPIIGILFFVLAKPVIEDVPMPAWLSEPRGQALPFDVPRR
ncbi:CopD family protein [Rubellimicrobium sp. CFH 75288]|uniref:CopD family protein n=1 Tax=Rubellimicrobium sp. CFH 75288 TaxID=2697034 RepID=UPI00141332A3|nr:CopD family protein [Rubellimicrobium sp. CFH 75288]NAZ37021.1 hypothetical protein [Rubellimicrobium sp. CFH 75288]